MMYRSVSVEHEKNQWTLQGVVPQVHEQMAAIGEIPESESSLWLCQKSYGKIHHFFMGKHHYIIYVYTYIYISIPMAICNINYQRIFFGGSQQHAFFGGLQPQSAWLSRSLGVFEPVESVPAISGTVAPALVMRNCRDTGAMPNESS